MPNFGPDFVDSNLLTSDLVREVRSHVQGSNRQAVNVLDADFDGTINDQVALKYPLTGVQPGQTIEIGWYEYSIVEVEPSAKQLTVIPTVEGRGGVHVIGDRVVMNPRYTTLRIIEQLNADLSALSAAGLYRVEVVLGSEGAALVPDGAVQVLCVWSDEDHTRKLPPAHYNIVDTTSGPVLRGPVTLGEVIFGCLLSPLSTTTDQVVADTTGLMPAWLDLPPMGASVRLMTGTESQRNIIDHQGETRRAEEVPVGGPTTAMRNLAALRQSRLVEEVARLQQRYGYISHVGAY